MVWLMRELLHETSTPCMESREEIRPGTMAEITRWKVER